MNTAPLQNHRVLHLRQGEVLRLPKSGLRCIEVQHGSIWLTAAPADGDVLLKSGEQFEPRHGWPIVLEPLADSEIRLSE